MLDAHKRMKTETKQRQNNRCCFYLRTGLMIGSVRAAAAAAPVVLVTDSLTNVRGYKLHARYWSPGACAVRGSVFLCHGFGEHLGWYEELAAALVTEGLLVFGHDHQVQHHRLMSHPILTLRHYNACWYLCGI